MEKTYNPQAIEQTLYQWWEAQGYFAPTQHPDRENYCIVIPPPNVTGSLHMGHAFQQTLMDTLIRYQRMQGKNSLWQVGTDHAGIATQMVVERQLAAKEQKSRHDYGREAFVQQVWQWKQVSGNVITQQMRRLGNSLDWQRERFTLDPALSYTVQQVFIRLHRENLIYRGKRLVNWDPALQTAISDLEVETNTVNGHLWYLRYPLAKGALTADGLPYLRVATTRPETLLGDSAVAVHPDDKRYQQLVGQTVVIPLVNRPVPIIADTTVDPSFGSGVVKITPAHDFNDYATGKRHQLPLINIFTPRATLREQAEIFNSDGTPTDCLTAPLPAKYHGLDRFAARQQLVADLQALGLLDQVQDHLLTLPQGDRSGVPIEPLLTDQWYLRVGALAPAALAAVESGAIQFVPQQYQNLYFAWMRELQDWCISRQLWWGHRIPAWYDTQGNVYVGADEAAVRQHYQLAAHVTLRQDEDVLDTWFSSALWSFSSLGWPEQTATLKAFHPTDVLVTGFDILFFWVARMIMLTMHLLKDEAGNPQVPFRQVYVTGLIRDENGQKMSKSKGNVLDPLDMIDGITLPALLEKRTAGLMLPQQAEQIRKSTQQQFPHGIQAHGTDALRFTLAALASHGRDIHWNMQRLAGYRNFCNKLWNASRFVLLHAQTSPQHTDNIAGDPCLSLADRWIRSELNETIRHCRHALDHYRFDNLATALYTFTWDRYCDWYLELAKVTLHSPNTVARQAVQQTLLQVLEALLRLAHPLIPFITETIWLALKAVLPLDGDTIMLQAYPEYQAAWHDQAATEALHWLQRLVNGIRQLRAEMKLPPGKKIIVLVRNLSETQLRYLEQSNTLICALARLTSVTTLAPEQAAPAAVTQLIDHMELLIPLTDAVPREAEQLRLRKALQHLDSEIARLQSKLANQSFVARAPRVVVTQEREKLARCHADYQKLQQQYQALSQTAAEDKSVTVA